MSGGPADEIRSRRWVDGGAQRRARRFDLRHRDPSRAERIRPCRNGIGARSSLHEQVPSARAERACVLDPQQANAAWRRTVGKKLVICMEQQVEGLSSMGPRVSVTDWHPLRLPKSVQHVAGFRVIANAKTGGRGTSKVYLDLILLAQSRTLTRISFSSLQRPFPSAYEAGLTRTSRNASRRRSGEAPPPARSSGEQLDFGGGRTLAAVERFRPADQGPPARPGRPGAVSATPRKGQEGVRVTGGDSYLMDASA
jgi:hypothetical protein